MRFVQSSGGRPSTGHSPTLASSAMNWVYHQTHAQTSLDLQAAGGIVVLVRSHVLLPGVHTHLLYVRWPLLQHCNADIAG